MRHWNLSVKYLLLLAAQVLVWNYFNFTPLLTVTILPVMILCLPLGCSVSMSLIIAFASGFAADFLVAGPTGLTILALVPVAFLRRPLLSMVFGSELLSRGEEVSSRRLGRTKMLIAITLSTALFLLIYITADSAGTSPLWVMAMKFAASLALSSAISLPIADLLCPDTEARWR